MTYTTLKGGGRLLLSFSDNTQSPQHAHAMWTLNPKPQRTLCTRVTDAAVAALAGPALRRLELYWNLRVTDGLLQALARASTRLES